VWLIEGLSGMGDGGVSAAFPYLNHKMPEKIKPTFVVAPKPLGFAELYSPRGHQPISIIAQPATKSYWRTRDDLTFGFYEHRAIEIMIITCRDTPKPGVVGLTYRTLCLDLAKLYAELEAKSSGSKEPLVRKKDKTLADDASLHKAAAAFILARLSLGSEPLVWPTSFELPVASNTPPIPSEALEAATVMDKEKMVTFAFLTGDSVVLEVSCSRIEGIQLDGIDQAHLKLRPSTDSIPAGATVQPTATLPVLNPAPAPASATANATVESPSPSQSPSPSPSPSPTKAAAANKNSGKLPSIDGAKAKASSSKKTK